jgi:CelD/BcsL family acetyltransferase involved in cellulose biosynthesis
MFKVEVIDSIEGLMPLKERWNRLLKRSNYDSVYLTWEWFVTWWKNFGKDKELLILLVKRGDEVIAIFPFMRVDCRCLGLHVKKIKALANDYTSYFDIITTVEEKQSLELAFNYLKKIKWDVIELGELLSNSKSVKILDTLSKKGLVRMHKEETVYTHPYIPISGCWAEYRSTLSRKFNHELNRRERNLEKIGRVVLEEFRKSDDLDMLLEESYQIEYSGWKGKAKTAILCHENVKNFYTDLAHIAAEKDWLSLFFLKVNGIRIAFMHNLRYKGIMESNKIGYNTAYSKYSPGNLLMKKTCEALFKGAFHRFNINGQYQNYKKDWTPYAQEFNTIWIYRNGAYPTLLYFIRFGIKNYFRKYKMLIKVKRYIFYIFFAKKRCLRDD